MPQEQFAPEMTVQWSAKHYAPTPWCHCRNFLVLFYRSHWYMLLCCPIYSHKEFRYIDNKRFVLWKFWSSGNWMMEATYVVTFLSSIPTRCYVIQYSLLLSMFCVFQAVSPPIIRSLKLYLLLAATASGSSKQAWHIPGAVCTVLSSWWRAEKPHETCRALTAIKNIV